MTDSPEDDSGLWFFQERSDPANDPDGQLSDSQETQRMPAVAPAPPSAPAQASAPAQSTTPARSNAPAQANAPVQSGTPAQTNAAQSVVDRGDQQAAQSAAPQSSPASWAQPPTARSEAPTVPTQSPATAPAQAQGPVMPP
ncbi:MAG: hypothetical protein QOD35_1024, partial [Nocardioidaceae bacterium]|nr:hypothetical protein [Nocardioidaceae bacterium]